VAGYHPVAEGKPIRVRAICCLGTPQELPRRAVIGDEVHRLARSKDLHGVVTSNEQADTVDLVVATEVDLCVNLVGPK
jgi:hypothetical protein